MKVEIYSDGSCLGNPGRGGYASLIICDTGQFWVKGNQAYTTNNRMELVALISAIEFLEKANFPQEIIIDVYTDSKYLQLGISKWIYEWTKNKWKNNKVLNIDLWQRLLNLKEKYPFSIHWIKGHSTNHFNKLVDYQARHMANIFQES